MRVALKDSARALSAAPDRAHGLEDPEPAAEPSEGLGRVLSAVVGVEDSPGQGPSRVRGVTKGGGDEVGAHVVGDGPPG